MTYSITYSTTKPENVEWYYNVEPLKVNAINEWTRSQPGFISIERVSVNSTSMVDRLTFDTQENFKAYRTASKLNADIIARKFYNDQNGITHSVIQNT